MVTESEFDNAFIFNSFVAPSGDQYKFFSSQIISRGGINSKREAGISRNLEKNFKIFQMYILIY